MSQIKSSRPLRSDPKTLCRCANDHFRYTHHTTPHTTTDIPAGQLAAVTSPALPLSLSHLPASLWHPWLLAWLLVSTMAATSAGGRKPAAAASSSIAACAAKEMAWR